MVKVNSGDEMCIVSPEARAEPPNCTMTSHNSKGQRPDLTTDENIIALLQRRAKRNARANRWNLTVLVLAYSLLVINTLVAIESKRTELVALIAVPGLVAIWIVSSVQGRRAERQALQGALQEYKELLSLNPNDNQLSEEMPSPAVSPSPLSDRELEVLSRIAKGDSNKEAALALFISEQTVKNHLKHIYSKLGVNDRTAAVLVATRKGWISVEDL